MLVLTVRVSLLNWRMERISRRRRPEDHARLLRNARVWLALNTCAAALLGVPDTDQMAELRALFAEPEQDSPKPIEPPGASHPNR